MTYLDFNATAPMPDCVTEAVLAAMRQTGNPSSVHEYGRQARALVESARGEVARLVGVTPEQIVFTSGATEANILALRGCGRARVLVSAIEHESVLTATADPEIIPVDVTGRIDLGALERLLSEEGTPAIVSVMLANNETGVIQPVAEVAALAHAAGALVHCDAVQAPGRIAVDFAALDVDLMSLSAHKLGGPKGVGALITRRDLPLRALQRGGGQERGLRGGTENLPGIAGFGAAAGWVLECLERASAVAALRDDMERRIGEAVPEVRIFGAEAPRLGNTSCIGLAGLGAETQVMALDLAGVAVSAGAACSSGKVKSSHVLEAMGADAASAGSAIRVSLGPATTQAEIDQFVEAWIDLARRASRDAA
ncbi:MAG: cysteine desulfurase [Alphaproteobacteria bacterium]|nr:cysteine desulfurase [Alphaproteobacteria bacterium]